ncbi:Neurotransmitter-gated ion-channel transmembrane region [Popillia japonica]|uniref:Neurotransmitter-gated ion-channel transmembrane region n=1 Tax=Popillia japonica TaxID=7064 RepID=A0AAW1MDW5_POPJA
MIWVPDIFFSQAHKSYFHDLMEPNTFVTVNQNGTVFRSARVTLILRCPMHFGRFPFDRHVCCVNIESYQWKAQDIHLQWLEDPVTRSEEILSPLFSFDKYTTSAGLIGMKSGEYSILSLDLYFSRQLKYYIVHLFIPCCLIFNVSCLACWLTPRLMTARVLIGLASLFSLAMLTLNFSDDTPKVPYLRSADIFTGMCMTFIFFTLVETIFVHLSESKQSENAIEEIEAADKDDVEQCEKVLPKRNAMKQMKKWLYENHQTLNDIDAAMINRASKRW